MDLDQAILGNLISLFNLKNDAKSTTALTGRTSTTQTNLDGIGSVIIKHYTRGGLISCFNKNRYFFSRKTRGELEFNALIDAIRAGVNVPEPVLFASKGGVFYKAWLVTREVKNSKNFMDFCINDKEKAIGLLQPICENIGKLIVSSIYHIDLHPGNIIINQFNKPYILDFDKACRFSGDKKKLAKKYTKRWQRAVRKYKLPEELSDVFSGILLKTKPE